MLSRKAKATFYAVAGPVMKVNGVLYRLLRAPQTGSIRIHLGPGQRNYVHGWVNVDANMFTARCDVWADLRNPLPFHDATAAAIYSHHMVEHLPRLGEHFREVFRCLRPGGAYRVGGPNGDAAIAKFTEGDTSWFSDFPDERTSIGGRFENFVFCNQEHLTILTHSFLEELMTNAGFVDIRVRKPVEDTGYPELFREVMLTESETDQATPHTLVVEGVRPERS